MPICKIQSSNFLSEKFSIGRGVRQGNPLSHTLFILCIECLANTLRDSHLFNELEIGGLSVKVTMFADYTLIFLNGLENQFEYVFDIFQAFGRISSCKLNLDKSEAFHIGSNIFRNDHPMAHLDLKWPQYTVNYLGVTIPIKPSKDKFELFRLNLENYRDELAPKLNLRKTRGLTLLKRISILKSLILSKLYMLLTEIHPPFVKHLNDLIYGFIWGSKWERISRLNLACSVEMGGASCIYFSLYKLCNGNIYNTSFTNALLFFHCGTFWKLVL